MQKNILLFLLVLIIPLCNYSMESERQKGHVTIDINDLSTELGVPDIPLTNVAKSKKKTNSELIELIKNHLNNDLTIGSDLSDQDKQIICSYLPILQKKSPERYTKLKQLFFKTIPDYHIVRGKRSLLDQNHVLIEKQLVILQVIAAAFKKSAEESQENNSVQKQLIEEARTQNTYLNKQNKIMKRQNRWERRVTITCGVMNVCLGIATVALGIATAYLSSIQAINN